MRSILVFLMLSLFYSSEVRACSCISGTGSRKQQIATAYQRDALVFVGRVVAVETIVTTDTIQVSDTGPLAQRVRLTQHALFRYTFAMSQKFKGRIKGSTVFLYSATQSASCGKEFKIDSEHLVYAYQVSEKAVPNSSATVPIKPYFATSICNRGQELKSVRSAELKQLRKLAKNNWP